MNNQEAAACSLPSAHPPPQSSTCLSSPCLLLLTPRGTRCFVLIPNIFKAKGMKRRGFLKLGGGGQEAGAKELRHIPGPEVLSQAPQPESPGHSLRVQDKELGWGEVELWKEGRPTLPFGEAVPGPKSTLLHPSGRPWAHQLLHQRAQRQSSHPQG